MVKIVQKKKKVVEKNSRHARINWEICPDSSEDKALIRYYIVVVDNKYREDKIKKVLNFIQEKSIINFSFEEDYGNLGLEGKVEGTDFRYLCKIYNSKCTSKYFIDAVRKVFGERWVRDRDLYIRVKPGTSLENYLADFFAK
jgi:hypothetical protein